ncbi:LemA family protein [uncultured Dialister sp.]|uniref:LemA family protein n=1 Tax=uncultured Dialister sp. TaxID=278064 RepID=UPI0025E4D876|nr:LemA family protein [uncultured Dialister sp.]
MKKLIVIIAAIFVIAGGFMSSYNGLVSMHEQVNSSWAQVDTQLQRRADLIPNLVNTVKGYASHEQEAVKAVADARSKLLNASTPSDKISANGELSDALGRLLMVAENYPNLKANQNFLALQDELSGTENRISVARRDYNNAVEKYNAKIHSFPVSLYAGAFGFTDAPYFKADEGAKAAPKVQF